MDKEFKDTTIQICDKMTLELKEVRGSSTGYARKDGFEEVSHSTRTCFHWRLRGLASKFSPPSDKCKSKDQEIYYVAITSDTFDIGQIFGGFKSREDAIKSALEFAKRNGIEVDGYKSMG